MPRVLTTNAQAKIAERFGNEPISVVGIFWNGAQEVFYADRDLPQAQGRILELGELDEVVKVDGSSSNASVSLVLDDTPGDIKVIFNSTDLHKKRVVIYQYFEGMDWGDKFIIAVGQINTPVAWSEGERKLSLTVLTKIDENEVGFAPEEGQFAIVNSKFIGKAWPLAFGDVLHVPAQQVTEQPRGVTQTIIGVPDYTLPYKYWHLVERLEILRSGYRYYCEAIAFLADVAREPTEIISDYVTAILEEDPRKQRHEDLSVFVTDNDKVVEKLRQLLNDSSVDDDEVVATVKPSFLGAAPSYQGRDGPVSSTLSAVEQVLQDRADVQAKINELEAVLGPAKQECEQLTRDLEALKGIKELLGIEVDNAEYAYKNTAAIIKKIEKLRINYVKTQHELFKVITIMQEHGRIPQGRVTVINGERFPQGEQVRVSINGMTYVGVFSGREFTTRGYEPRYENLAIGPREDDQLDAFWLADDSVNIKGHYCITNMPLRPGMPEYLLAQSGVVISNPVTRMFRVSDQFGRKCIIDLIELNPSVRIKKQAPNMPLLQDLPQELWDSLQYAQEHTAKERERILEGALEKYDRNELDRIKVILEKLRDVVFLATYDDEVASVNETIHKNVHEYNDRVSRLTFTKEVVDKAFSLISEEEFATLLKLCNLQLRLVDQEVFDEAEAPVTDIYYITGPDITLVNATSAVVLPQWLSFSPGGQELTNNRTVIALPGGGKIVADFLPESTLWVAEPGSEVSLVTDTTIKYVANIIPSTVRAVYAWKAVNGVRQLVPVPLSYYTKSEDDPAYTPLACTTITLKKPLKDYVGEDWEEGVYVSMQSSVGPNTADIISWILTTFTSVVPNSGNFSAVGSKIANFPSSFALFEKQEALSLVQEIAWQARCAVVVFNGVAQMVYLSEVPTPAATVSASDVLAKSLSVEYTNTDDITTKFVARWRPDYAKSETESNRITLRYNVPRYGEVVFDHNFTIYNIESLVLHSATFWMVRRANTWKRVKFKTPLNRLDLQTMDAVTLDLPQVASAPVVAVVEKAQFDSADNTIQFECWTPVRAGEMSPYDFAWPAGLSTTTLYPSVDEINAGYAGSPRSSVPKNAPYKIQENVNLVDQLVLRPKDYGEPFPSDERFSLPPSPLLGLSEEDYIRLRPGQYTLPEQPRASDVQSRSPTYESPVGGGSRETKLPIERAFIGRVVEVSDPVTGTYRVQTTDGIVRQVAQFASLGTLNLGQAVLALYDDRQKRYVTNEDSQGSIQIATYYVVSEDVDRLTCVEVGASALSNSFDGNTVPPGSQVRILKPRTLQQSPYNGKMVTLNGVDVTYTTTGVGRRTATATISGSPVTEDQWITPPYFKGDVITAKLVRTRGESSGWVDMNEAGRQWAKK